METERGALKVFVQCPRQALRETGYYDIRTYEDHHQHVQKGSRYLSVEMNTLPELYEGDVSIT